MFATISMIYLSIIYLFAATEENEAALSLFVNFGFLCKTNFAYK